MKHTSFRQMIKMLSSSNNIDGVNTLKSPV